MMNGNFDFIIIALAIILLATCICIGYVAHSATKEIQLTKNLFDKLLENGVKIRAKQSFDWYIKNAYAYKIGFYFLTIMGAVCSLVVTFLSTFSTSTEDWNHLRLACAGLALVSGLITTLLGLFKFNEQWHNNRSAAEAIKHEIALKIAKADYYAGCEDEEAERKFAMKIEEHIVDEYGKREEIQKGKPENKK